MKFTQEINKFRPAIITLETQEEVDVLHALVGGAPGRHADGVLYKLYRDLSKISDSESGDYWEGRLFSK